MTNAAIDAILTKLGEVFADTDAQVLEASKEWAKQRAVAITEFKKNNDSRSMSQHDYYSRLFAVAGGKTWYNLLWGRTASDRDAIMVKHCAAVVAKRNQSIASKLIKANVTKVLSSEFAHTNDGFNGVFSVETDAGEKRVIIDTILAGGYNIQCLHQRVLVKVK